MELLDRLHTAHEPDVANTAEFVFCWIDSPYFSFSLFQGLYLHISIILVQNILMNYSFVVSLYQLCFYVDQHDRNSFQES